MSVLIKLVTLVGVILLGGCMVDKGSMTVDERVDQESRMRRFLNDSSPRNMNEEPKVTPELSHRFVIPKGSQKAFESQDKSNSTSSIPDSTIDPGLDCGSRD